MTRQLKKILNKIYVLANVGYTNTQFKKYICKKIPYLSYYKIEQLMRQFNIVKMNHKCKYSPHKLRLMLYLYQHFYDTDKLCEYLQTKHNIIISVKALRTLASRHNIQKNNCNRFGVLSYQEEKQLVKEYLSGKYSTKYLRNKYNFATNNSIIQKVKKHHGNVRTSLETKQLLKSYNGFTLQYIDSKEKAYYLGLLLTDGWVSENRLFLDLTDYDVMQWLAKTFNVHLRTCWHLNAPNKKISYRFSITYPNMLNDIYKYGLVERKTFILGTVNLLEQEEHFVKYIIRGIIDGDGWISQCGDEFFISSASEAFLRWCQHVLEDNFGMINLHIYN